MNNLHLIIYKFSPLYKILKELDEMLHFHIIEISDEKLLNHKIQNLKNYLIIVKKEILINDNQLIIDKLPMKFSKLIEKLNIMVLKQNFSNQSEQSVGNYLLNLNARELSLKGKSLNLTEKEINIILYLSKMTKPSKIEDLQRNIWKYQSNTETHTVETHIYRLRKKIFKFFNDENFIVSKKNGYQIK